MSVLVLPSLFNISGWTMTLGASQFEFWKIVLQFFVVFVVVSWFYFKIQGTYIAQFLKGITVLLALYIFSNVLSLTIISGILQAVLLISIIGFIILFQPELRRLLVYLGQPDLFSKPSAHTSENDKTPEHMLHELIESIRLLSKTKTGALIVLESNSGIGGAYLEAGTRLDARLSTELLLTVFHPNTPLHDGAVIVSPDSRILAAGVLLPLSENPNLSWKYGTRHRAAIGLSEISDSRCIVVSEETGTISLVYNGNLEKMNTLDDLKQHLETILGVDSTHKKGQKRLPLAELLSTDILQKLFSKTSVSKQTPDKTIHPEDRPKINS
jgi:diadenylate cyclase